MAKLDNVAIEQGFSRAQIVIAVSIIFTLGHWFSAASVVLVFFASFFAASAMTKDRVVGALFGVFVVSIVWFESLFGLAIFSGVILLGSLMPPKTIPESETFC